jgi:hypothetical protein
MANANTGHGTPCPYEENHRTVACSVLSPSTVILNEVKDLSGEILRLRLRMTNKLA